MSSLNSMLLPENAIEVLQGESKTLRLTVTQPDPSGETSSIPLILENSTIYFTVKVHASDREHIFQKTSAQVTEIDITNPRAGVAEIYITPGDTISVDPDTNYVYDVWVLFTATGKRYPVVKPSIFRVVSGVTKLSI